MLYLNMYLNLYYTLIFSTIIYAIFFQGLKIAVKNNFRERYHLFKNFNSINKLHHYYDKNIL